MKKIYKIICVNIFILTVVLFVLDYVCFKIEAKKYLHQCKTSGNIFKYELSHFCKVRDYDINTEQFRPTIKTNSSKSVLLLGCSYTYGTGLEEHQIFSYHLAKKTGRTVYNLGIQGGGIQHSLYLTKDKNFTEKYPNVDTIVYTYIDDHINRLNEFLKMEISHPFLNFRLVKKNGDYVRANDWYQYPASIFLFRMILKNVTAFKNSQIFYKENVAEFAEMVNLTKANLKKYYPNAKFIFFVYNTSFSPELSAGLDKDIIVIKTEDLTKENLGENKYKNNLDPHPSEAAWIELVPKLVKKLNL